MEPPGYTHNHQQLQSRHQVPWAVRDWVWVWVWVAKDGSRSELGDGVLSRHVSGPRHV